MDDKETGHHEKPAQLPGGIHQANHKTGLYTVINNTQPGESNEFNQ